MALHQRACSFLRGQARPGDQERLAARVVHAFSREVSEVAELLDRWQAGFQAGGPVAGGGHGRCAAAGEWGRPPPSPAGGGGGGAGGGGFVPRAPKKRPVIN